MMIKGCYNIKKYTEEFILKVSWWIKLLIAPVVALVIVSNYLEIECSKLATSISTDLLQIKSKIIQFGIYLFALETMKYLTNIFITFFVSSSIKRAYFVFMKEYLSIKYEDFTKLSSGDIQYDIQRRSIAISDFLTVLTISFISNAIFFIVVCQKLIVSLSLEAALKSIILVTIFLIVVVYSQRMKSTLRVKVNQGFIRNSRKVCDVLLNYERIVAYDNIDIECKKYEDVSKSQEYHAKLFWSSYEFIFFINRILFALLAAFIIYEFKKMNLITNDLTIFEIIGIINALDPKINALSYSIDQLCLHFTNFNQSTIEGYESDDEKSKLKIYGFDHSLGMKNLSLKLNNQEILKRVNLEIIKGQKVAIVGPSGAGKSTILKLVMGFYDNYTGDCKIDSHQYSYINKRRLRDVISYIPQNLYLKGTDLYSNLTMGDTTKTPEKIIEICKTFNYHDTFKEIGYMKNVGVQGKNLSGGQKQKVNFMRALIKNGIIFIFDEPTSNMDKLSEQNVFNHLFSKMFNNKTLIMTVTNLSLLERFDKILFLENGELKGKGKLGELLANNNGFADFYEEGIKNFKN